jgi:hypothetical protein
MKKGSVPFIHDAGFRDQSVPTPATKSNVTITIKGLAPGTYTIEKWSTTDTNLATQKQQPDAVQAITQGQDLIFTISNLGTTANYDWAYKIHQ